MALKHSPMIDPVQIQADILKLLTEGGPAGMTSGQLAGLLLADPRYAAYQDDEYVIDWMYSRLDALMQQRAVTLKNGLYMPGPVTQGE